MTPARACESMDELRAQIDALDAEIVALLARRASYIDRAAEIKARDGLPARIPDRVDEVLDRVAAAATDRDLDPALVRRLWAELIEWSIAREAVTLGDA